jgi:large subunit ribosomal protein L24
MYIKVGDTVAIIAGKDRFSTDENGKKTFKSGKVVKVFFKEQKVLVEGINIATKHKNPSDNENKRNIIKEELPIHVSNVAAIDPVKNVPTRVGFRFESGKKVRYAKKSSTILDISK